MARWKARAEFLLSAIGLVFLSLTCVTDRRTDGQTDGIAVANTALAMRRAVKIAHNPQNCTYNPFQN